MKDFIPDKLQYSPTNFARVLDISKTAVYDLMKHGLIAYVRYGADRRIPASEAHRLVREGIPSIPKKEVA